MLQASTSYTYIYMVTFVLYVHVHVYSLTSPSPLLPHPSSPPPPPFSLTPPHPPSPIVPSRPEIVTITPTTPTSLNVMWAPSANRQGTPQFFLYYTSLPQSPPNFWAWSMMPLTSESRTAVIDNLSPFTNYYVIVSANTSCGTNQSFVQTQRTLQDFPSAPRSLRVTAALPTSVTIRWEPPTSPNGVITMYKVSQLNE